MSNITVDFATYLSDAPFNASDFVTLADDSSVLDALTDSQIDALATNNVDVISATDGVLSWTADQYAHLITGPVAIDPDTFAIMADTGADIAALSATQIGEIAAEGVAVVNPTDSVLDLRVDQFEALGAMSVDASADFTIADTGAHLASMDAGQIASLGILGIDHLDATDDVLSLSISQYQALGTVTLTAADTVTLADTGTNLETLSVDDIGNLGANGIDSIHATDGAWAIDLADFNALGAVTLTQSDTVTLADTGATISGFSTSDIDALAAGGIDIFDATDNTISFTIAQYLETVTDNISLTAANTVTLADAGAALAGLSAAQIGALVNVDAFDATDDALTLSVAQYDAVEGNSIALTAGDTVTLSDTAADLATLDFSTLAAANVDQLHATTAYTTLTVAQLTALGTVVFADASSVTLTDTGAAIAAVSDFSVFAAHGVDTLDASDNTLTISEAQFQALGTTTLTGSDTVTISDTAANIVGGPNYGTLAAAGIDFLNATTAINVTVNDINNLGTVVFTTGSTVTLADTGAHLSAVANFTTYGTHGVDRIDASNNTLTINATQFGELGSVTLTAADTVTISDTAVHLGALTFSGLAAANIDFLNSTNAYTTLTVQNVTDLGTVHFTAASNVTLTDTAADIQAVSDFTTFATHGVDTIKSSGNALSLAVSQFTGLGTTHLTGSDAVTLADTAAHLDAYLDTAGTQTMLSTNGVDTIHATGGSLSADAVAFNTVHGAGAVFASGDTVTLADTDAHIVALDFTMLHAAGIDAIDATDDALTISLAQYLDVAGTVAFTGADTVTVGDSAAVFEALSTGQLGALGTNLVDDLSVTSGGDLDWSVAQWQALPGGVSVGDAGFALVVDDSESNIEALSGAQLGALAASGAQELASTGGALDFTVSQAEGFLGTGLAIAPGDTGTLVDIGADIATLSATQIDELAGAGFDSIDASDDAISLTVAQFSALGTVHLTGADAVTLADTSAQLNAYLDAAGAEAALSANGVDTIHATGGSLSVDAVAFDAVHGAGAVFLGGDTVTLADTGSAIAALDFTTLASTGVDTIDASDNALNITVAQYLDVAGTVAFTAGDAVTIADSEANIAALTTMQIAALATNLVGDLSVASGGDLDWTVAQWRALPGGVLIGDAGHHLVVADSEANIEALSGAQLGALAASGAQELASTGGALDFTVGQAEGFLATGLSATGTVTLVDSAANIEAMTGTQIGELAAAGFGTIHSTDDALTLDVMQLVALGPVTLTGADAVTLADTASDLDAYLDGAAANQALSANGVDTIHATGGTLSVDAQAIDHVAGTGASFATGDSVTLADTGAHIAALNFSVLSGLNVDAIDATNNTLSITLDQYDDIAGTVTLAIGDDVTVTGNLDNLSTTDIAGFATNHVDHLLDGDGFNEVIWNVAQWDALTTAVTIDNANHIPFLNVVFDSGANLGAVTATQVANFVAEGAEVFEGQPPGQETVTWNVAQLQAMGSAVWASTEVIISDTGANLEAIGDYTIFATHGVTSLSASDTDLTLNAAQFGGLGSVTVDAANTFTLADTAQNIEAMGTDGYAAMAAAGVDLIHATDGSLTVTFEEFSAIYTSSTVFLPSDHVTLTGSQAQLFDSQTTGYFSSLGTQFHVDEISLTGSGVGHLDVDQWNALVTGGTTIDSANNITLEDTGVALGSETAADVAAMAGQIDHWESNDGNTVVAGKALLDALITASIDFTPNNYVVLFSDTEATVEGLTATQLEGYIAEGVTAFRASDTSTLNIDVSQVSAVLDNGAYFVPANTVTLVDSAANIEALSATQFGGLVTGFVDVIDATGGTLDVTVADFEAVKTALHSGSLTLANTAELGDTGAAISALTTTELGQLSGDNITSISATGDIDFTQAQLTAAAGVTLATTGAIVLADSETNIEGLSTAAIDGDASAGVSEIHSTDASDKLTFSVAQTQHILSDGITVDNAAVVISDTGAHISSFSFAQLNGMGIAGFTGIVDTSGDITWSFAQLDHLSVPLTLNGNGLVLSDTEAVLEAQNASTWAHVASLATSITASDTHTLNLGVSQISPLFGTGATFAAGDTVTLTDGGANIAALTAIQIGELSAIHVDAINASDDALTLSVAQFGALNGVTLTAGDTVTLSDSSTSLETLNFGTLAAANVDVLDATDNVLAINVSQFNALGAVALTAGDTVTISDTAANITTLDFSTLAGKNVDVLDVSTPFSLSVARYEQMGAVKFAAADNITLRDAGADITALTAVQIGQIAANGIGHIDASDNALTLSVAQYNALGAVALTAGDTVTLADAGANLATLNFATLAASGVDVLDATNNLLSLTVAKFQALGSVQLTAADVVTLADTGANIAALTAAQIGALAAAGIDKLDASNNVLSLSVAQFSALGTVALTGGDTVTLSDIGANLETLNFSTLAAKGVDVLDASDNVLTLTAAQFQSLGTVSLKSSDTVTLSDTGADISALTVGQFNALSAKGIDILDATDNAYSLTVVKVEGISPALTLAANDIITVRDSEANIEGMSGAQIAAAVARGIDIFHASNATLNMNVSQVSALLGTGAVFASGDAVTLTDTGASIQGLSAAQIGQLASAGVDKIDATDNALTLDIAQYEALGGVQLSAGDTNTLADAYIPGLADLSTTVIAGLAAEHISHVHGTFMFEWSAAQWAALASSITVDTAVGLVRLYDTAANIQSLTPTQIAAFHAEGVAQLEVATQGGGSELDFSVAQTDAITTAGLGFTTDNGSTAAPTITDTGAAIAAMTAAQIAAAAGDGFTAVNATDNMLTLSLAQFNALGAMTLASADAVTVSDTEASIEALTNSQLTAMAANHVDVIHSQDGVLNVSVAQVGALLGTGTHFDLADAVTLVDAGSAISSLDSVQIGALAATGIDSIDASDNLLSLSIAQYIALGTVTLTAADVVTLSDTGVDLAGLNSAAFQALHAAGIDAIDASDNAFSLTVGQAHALVNQRDSGTVTLTANSALTVSDSGAHLAGLSVSDLNALAGLGGSITLDATDNAVSYDVAQMTAILADSIALAGTDTVTLSDTSADLNAFLTAPTIAALGAAGVRDLDVSNNAISLSKIQLDALSSASVALTGTDTVTMADTEAHLEALTAAQFTSYASQGVDIFHASGSILALSESQVAAVLNSAASFKANDAVTLADSATNIQALSVVQFGQLAAKGVDIIDIVSGAPLSLSAADYQALGTFTIVGGAVTLSDAGANIATLSAAQFGALTGTGITHIDATDNALSLTAAEATAVLHQVNAGTVTFDATDTVTVADTGAAIAGMSAADLAALGADGAGHVVLDATDDAIAFTIAQFNALHTANLALTPGDTITLADSEAGIEALTGTQLAAYAAQGVDDFAALGGTLHLSEAQIASILATSASFESDDTVTLSDTGTDIAALSAAQFAQLAAHGVDMIDATDNALSLTIAQYRNLHGVTLAGADVVTLTDTGADIAKLKVAAIGALAAGGVDIIDASNNAITFSLDKYNALGSVQLAANDVITVNGTAGADAINGRPGNQILNGFGGDDTFSVGIGNHTLNGGTGVDTVTYGDATAGVTANLATGLATTGAWTDHLSAIENVTGSDFNDVITGNSGVNVLNGGGGNDTLIGGAKADTLTGGAGADTFVYQSVTDSTRGQSDTITDFSHAEGDKIDVSAIASFTFVDHLTHHADQLAIIDLGGGVYQVVADVNGDGVADLAILVHSSTALVAGDFVL